MQAREVLSRALIQITKARDHNADYGEYPKGLLGEDQAFDDWAADLAEAALSDAGSPECGHSACRQAWIDGDEDALCGLCVKEKKP